MPRQVLALLIGGVLVALLLRVLPAPVFAATRAFLLVAASGILLLVALALFLLPARRFLASLFALPLTVSGPTFGLPPEAELRTTMRPLVAVGIVLGILMVATLLR